MLNSFLLILASYLLNRHQYVQINDMNLHPFPWQTVFCREVLKGRFFILLLLLFYYYWRRIYQNRCSISPVCWWHKSVHAFKTKTFGSLCNSTQQGCQRISRKQTKSLLFSTQQMARRHQVNFELTSSDNKVIECVSHFMLLAVTFSQDLKWNHHVKKATSSACA